MKNEIRDIVDDFLSLPRYKATYKLASYGSEAIPVLLNIFNGTLKNKFGVPYSSINLEYVRCALVTCRLIGESEIKLSDSDLEKLNLAIRPFLEDDLGSIWEEASNALFRLNLISEEDRKSFYKLKIQKLYGNLKKITRR